MSSPTLSAITSMKNYITQSISGGFSQTDIYLCTALNDPHYSGNPIPQPMVYGTYNTPTILGLISPSSIKNILASPGVGAGLLPLLNTTPHTIRDVTFANSWALAFESVGLITPSEYVSITGVINTKVGDSSWNSGVSWSYVNLGRSVDLEDIEACR